jgi:RimJ/RimL family protein N-acetyltransferase
VPGSPPFVPEDFVPPAGLAADLFVLEPLGPEHTEPDYDAWTSSMEHIRSTPGFTGGDWPREMTLEENRADLERHARDFEQRKGFTYTVLDRADGAVIGCVYIYPGDSGVRVLSWVRAASAELDAELWRAVSAWLADSWPFERVEYAARS